MNKEELVLAPELPLLPIRDIVMFPYMIIPFFVGREESIRAVNYSTTHTSRIILLSSQKDINIDKPGPDDIYPIATASLVVRTKNVPDGRVKILVQGLHKVRITEYVSSNPYICKYEIVDDPVDLKVSDEQKALIGLVKENLETYVSMGKLIYPEVMTMLEDTKDPGRLADLVSANLGLKLSDSYEILSELDPIKRLDKVNKFLFTDLEIIRLQQKIKNNTKEEVTKSQREYFLREQLQSIKRELGENEDKDGYLKKIKAAKMSPDAEKEALKQAKRLDSLNQDSSEGAVIKNYLDWMVDLPWAVSTEDNADVKRARTILEEDHFGMKDVKERILEFLSVKKLNPEGKGSILCLVGPPGVGKTSICKSIAKSLDRKYVRQSLGGVRDEADVRGHRRTYLGSMPGRIIQGLKQAGSNNPVFVLDEIDKIGRDMRGDPASALLELLDPEQNHNFHDHYINVGFDVSKAFFIATANTLDTIPAPLLDRMEVVTLPGYTENEKIEICRKYLIPKQKEQNGLKKVQVEVKDEALPAIIRGYTRENGLRNLEKQVSKVFRKVARKFAEENVTVKSIDAKNLKDYLGVAKYTDDVFRKKNMVGVTMGLAWTSVGGTVLELEAIKVPAKDMGLHVTGQLGEVMKESSQIAYSVVKSKSKGLGFNLDDFRDTAFHVHALDGAVPKDGPSAGITMATCLASLMSGVPVRHDVAMTGELSLTGRVLPIGGLKEKMLAAVQYGSKTVIIPKDNAKDLDDVPKEILDKVEVCPVSSVDEVFKIALVQPEVSVSKPKAKPKKKKSKGRVGH